MYQIQCSGCNKNYIGSTIRQLHLRIKEHLTSDLSAVKRHLATCTAIAQISVKVLSHDNDEKNLRLREAILIMDHKPLLNNKEEETRLLSLVQPVKWTLKLNPDRYYSRESRGNRIEMNTFYT